MAVERRDPAAVGSELPMLLGRIERLALRPDRLRDSPLGQRQLRCALEDASALLLARASRLGLETEQSRPIAAAREVVEIHLRAASDVEAAAVRPDVLTKVLVRGATAILSEIETNVVLRHSLDVR